MTISNKLLQVEKQALRLKLRNSLFDRQELGSRPCQINADAADWIEGTCTNCEEVGEVLIFTEQQLCQGCMIQDEQRCNCNYLPYNYEEDKRGRS